jgi:hypothetical protein
MAGQIPTQAKVVLEQSYNTSTVDDDIYEFGSTAPHEDFQGILRDGGITNNYLGVATINVPANATLTVANNSATILTGNGNVYVAMSPWDATQPANAVSGNTFVGNFSTWHIERQEAPISGANDVDARVNKVLKANFSSGYMEEYDYTFVNTTTVLTNAVNLGVPIEAGAAYMRAPMFPTGQRVLGIAGYRGADGTEHANSFVMYFPYSYEYVANSNSLSWPDVEHVDPKAVAYITVNGAIFNEQSYGRVVHFESGYFGGANMDLFAGKVSQLNHIFAIGMPGVSYQRTRAYPGVLPYDEVNIPYTSYVVGHTVHSDVPNINIFAEANYAYEGHSWGVRKPAEYVTTVSGDIQYVNSGKLQFVTTAGFTSTNTVTGVNMNAALCATSISGITTAINVQLANTTSTAVNVIPAVFPKVTFHQDSATNLPQCYSYNYAESCVEITDDYGVNGPTHILWNNPDDAPDMMMVEVPGYFRPALEDYDIDNKAQYTIQGFGVLHTTGAGIEIRAGLVDGLMSFLSVGKPGELGQLITAVGEIDPYYPPWIVDSFNDAGVYESTTIQYRYSGAFYKLKLVNSPVLGVQKLTDNLYKLDTLSPLNILDVDAMRLHLGPNDWNNRGIVYATYTASGTRETAPINWTTIVESENAGGLQTGEKSTYNGRDDSIIVPVSAKVSQFVLFDFENPSLKAYKNLSYIESTDLRTLQRFIDQNATPDYIQDLVLPTPMGLFYDENIIYDLAAHVTYIRSPRYDGYKLGNQIVGAWSSFDLFGSIYLYNRQVIQALLTDQSGTVTAVQPLAKIPGLVRIAETPTQVFFRSDWDKSLYNFTGQRETPKVAWLNRLGTILDGTYNIFENTLALILSDRLLFQRDEIISEVPITAVPSIPTALYSTTEGIWFVGTEKDGVLPLFKYSYLPETHSHANSTVQPLVWQSAHYGFDKNTRAVVQNAVITLKTDTVYTANVGVAGLVDCFDQDNHYADTYNWTIIPYSANKAQQALVGGNVTMWSNSGQARIRIQPTIQRSLGTSIGVTVNDKVIMLDATFNFAPDGQATIVGNN